MSNANADVNTEQSLNQLKYENYKEQYKRLNKALANGFNLEAMFIEYAIIEDRTESILRHADRWEQYLKSLRGRYPALESKIRYIRKCAESNRKDLLNRYFSDDLLDKILVWKEERNKLIHALLKQQFGYHELDEIAGNGKKLADQLRNRATSYNRAADRKRAKEQQ